MNYSLIQVFDDPKNGFRGNIAAVAMLPSAIDDITMQTIANDLNQPATSFLWPANDPDSFHVRWFAPDGEIGLCGHGSLAAIAFLDSKLRDNTTYKLLYRNGIITGHSKEGNRCSINITRIENTEAPIPEIVKEGLGIPVQSFHQTSNKHIVLVENEGLVADMRPDFERLRDSEIFGYIVTAPGDETDFVSRTLVPHVQQLEDHATGSSHAALTPFWADRLGKKEMSALQLSPRKGKFWCGLEGLEVSLSGNYTKLADGTFYE